MVIVTASAGVAIQLTILSKMFDVQHYKYHNIIAAAA